eukprot:g4854.t2
MGSNAVFENDVSLAVADKRHCELCFDVLLFEFKQRDSTEPSFPDAHCGVFVTWHKRCQTTDEYSMRGCIGTLEPRWLHHSIKEYSLKSAFDDRRFDPIWEEEVPFLSCDVSLLFCYEVAKNWQDWEIGVHGLIIKFNDERHRLNRSATYLPEVPKDNSWSREETLKNLIRKAGG